MKWKKKRQRTHYWYHANYADGTYIRMGIVHNAGPTIRHKQDCVRLQYKSDTSYDDLFMTPAEAFTFAKGLIHCVHVLHLQGNLKMVKRP